MSQPLSASLRANNQSERINRCSIINEIGHTCGTNEAQEWQRQWSILQQGCGMLFLYFLSSLQAVSFLKFYCPRINSFLLTERLGSSLFSAFFDSCWPFLKAAVLLPFVLVCTVDLRMCILILGVKLQHLFDFWRDTETIIIYYYINFPSYGCNLWIRY